MLNDDPTVRVKEETRALVRSAATELGYVPNSSARALRKAQSKTLGLVLNSAASSMYVDVVNAAQREAAAHGYFLLLIDADEVVTDPRLFREVIVARRVDGLLLQGGFGGIADALVPYADLLPSVFFNSSGTENSPGVRLQDVAAATLATEHLLALGHERIAFVSGLEGETSDSRAAGFSAAKSPTGAFSPETIEAGWSADDCHDAVLRYLESGGDATAYVVVNALAATGVLSALRVAGRSVPSDASVIAIHDPWFARHFNPPLTTVRLPLAELGSISVRTLIQKIESSATGDIILDQEPELVFRESTAAV